jgi:hypothetical protein
MVANNVFELYLSIEYVACMRLLECGVYVLFVCDVRTCVYTAVGTCRVCVITLSDTRVMHVLQV